MGLCGLRSAGWSRNSDGNCQSLCLTSHHFKFDEMEKAFWMMASKEDNMIKPVIHFE